jgi:hypothetical protein
MVIALFPTKTNLWFCVLVLHLGSVKGKALKNLSDYPPSLGRCVTLLGKLAVFCLFQFLSIFLISLRFQVNFIVTVPLRCVNV